MPEAAVVPSWASCTIADAMAGLVPIISSRVVEVTPYAIPRLPSTSWAATPTRANMTSFCTGDSSAGGSGRCR